MKERLAKLISIKSIVTILFVVIMLTMSAVNVIARGEAIPEQLWTILGMIIAFYFGTVAEKIQAAPQAGTTTATEAPPGNDSEVDER